MVSSFIIFGHEILKEIRCRISDFLAENRVVEVLFAMIEWLAYQTIYDEKLKQDFSCQLDKSQEKEIIVGFPKQLLMLVGLISSFLVLTHQLYQLISPLETFWAV